jgi:hypothetical protein
MKKIFFAILLMALTTAAFGYSYEFQVTSNAAGTVDISLKYGDDTLGSLHYDFSSAGTQSKTVNIANGCPDRAEIHGESAFRPADHDYQTLDDVYPVTQINYVTVDIDGQNPPPDPGEGDTED